ncbi:MAG: M3 family oligoendopeptidase [Alphaproteobacteria bacterium]|nr:MAG: M3 family oligoendopeptidase [Alphaproteobacteria bacterium]TAF40285.1 MAG: M3 family oligoendopeptidase [Alphaproteobacteria bacterium]TAF77419.1 MAG: M3 family oligoendopeptidase [Alphaproteobacteria bacterium]
MRDGDVDVVPSWRLDDLFAHPDAPELHEHMQRVRDDVFAFAASWRGKLQGADGQGLAAAIAAYERIHDDLGCASSYGDLLFAADAHDAKVIATYQAIEEWANELATHLVFFSLEINQMAWDHLEALCLTTQELAHYLPWLRDVRDAQPHQLDERTEQLFIEKSISAHHAWIRLYDDLCVRMKIQIGDASYSLTHAIDMLSDAHAQVRYDAASALAQAFAQHKDNFALILNVLMKDKAIDDAWHHFATPDAERHLANQVEPEIVARLVESVTAHYADISHRYYRFKAKMMGRERLHYADRNAPIDWGIESETYIPWQDAKNMVLDAYRAFSPHIASLAQRFFDEEWIDADVRDGKTSGAFSHPVTPSKHPYILMNYQGKMNDVMTLAHELGHGVHQLLAAHNGALMADTPLTLAETASVFGEQLVFRHLLEQAPDPRMKQRLMADKIEDMLNTVVRQIAFYHFEMRVHQARKDGELSAEAIAQHWFDVQQESLGDAFDYDDDYAYYWCYVSHFYHSPFYVYAYAFGECLVHALYARYEYEKSQHNAPWFLERYTELLAAGGTQRHKELLQPLGLDLADAGFWNQGMQQMVRLMDALEATLA